MTALVTGGTGLIGNAVARALVARGEPVRALVRDPERGRHVLPAGVEIVQGDLTDKPSIEAAVRDTDVVYHAGGMPEQWARDPGIFDRVNRQGTANVLEAALRAGVRRVVYTSTMDVFREGPDGRLRETEIDPNPKPSVYERSKQAAEREADRIRGMGLDVVFLNPASVYGPSPTETGMMQFFLRMRSGKVPMVPPGGMSLAYVESVAEAHLTGAEKGVSGERYLLADAHATMRELAEITVRVMGSGKVPRVGPAWLFKAVAGVSAPAARIFGFTPMLAPDGLGFLLWNADVDATKAVRKLGYRQLPLEEGIRRTLEHLSSRA